MAYRKFDDPGLNASNAKQKLENFYREPHRRALQGVVNRVISGTDGQFGSSASAGTAATGVQVANSVKATINGSIYTISATNNLNLGTGAYSGEKVDKGFGKMGTNCVARFLIYGGTDGKAYVAGPGNIVDKGGYSTPDLAAAVAKLPDLPDNCVALGSVLVHGPAASKVDFSVGGIGTMGTCTFTDLVHMPYQEPFKAEA